MVGTVLISCWLGKTIISGAAGHKTATGGNAVQLDTVFWLASMSKFLTSIAVLQLVEAGKLSLDDDVSKIVPVLGRSKIVTGFETNGAPILKDRTKAITLRHLLTHSSGAGYAFMQPNPELPDLVKYLDHVGRHMDDGATVNERFDTPLVYEPGEGWNYGTGITWAGQVLEVTTGQTLEEYLRRNVLDPVGVTSITFFPNANPDVKARLAGLTARDPSGGIVDIPPIPFLENVSDAFGGEAAYGSVEDYMKIVHSILADDEKILKKATTAQMFQPHLSEESRLQLAKTMAIPNWVVGDFTGPQQFDWGLGGLLVVGNDHSYRKRSYLTWGGAPNLVWVCIAPVYTTLTTAQNSRADMEMDSLSTERLVYVAYLGRKFGHRLTRRWKTFFVHLRRKSMLRWRLEAWHTIAVRYHMHSRSLLGMHER